MKVILVSLSALVLFFAACSGSISGESASEKAEAECHEVHEDLSLLMAIKDKITKATETLDICNDLQPDFDQVVLMSQRTKKLATENQGPSSQTKFEGYVKAYKGAQYIAAVLSTTCPFKVNDPEITGVFGGGFNPQTPKDRYPKFKDLEKKLNAFLDATPLAAISASCGARSLSNAGETPGPGTRSVTEDGFEKTTEPLTTPSVSTHKPETPVDQRPTK